MTPFSYAFRSENQEAEASCSDRLSAMTRDDGDHGDSNTTDIGNHEFAMTPFSYAFRSENQEAEASCSDRMSAMTRDDGDHGDSNTTFPA